MSTANLMRLGREKEEREGRGKEEGKKGKERRRKERGEEKRKDVKGMWYL
jgi:hypothetical protein